MDAMEYFLSYIMQLRMVLDQWQIPFLGCSYWDFVMGVAIASVVITVLVSAVRIGTVTYSESRHQEAVSSRRERVRSDNAWRSRLGDFAANQRRRNERKYKR